MSIIIPSKGGAQGGARGKASFNSGFLFESPQPAGRKITAGFTYLQRIGKGASYDVWFPPELKQALEIRKQTGLEIGHEQFPAQWAAVRQFELLHESGNHKIYDLDPDNLKRCFQDLSKSMRAGGYRITVATLGSYRETSSGDELEILDRRLQKRIAQMIHMLYLDTQSAEINEAVDKKLAEKKWDYRHELPHVGMVLGAGDLFHPTCADDDDEEEKEIKRRRKGGSGETPLSRRAHRKARQFFDILDQLPHSQIVHDTAIGLQLPELNGNNEWNYIANPEETLGAFNRLIGDVFGKFNRVSLGKLQGRASPDTDAPTATYHLRGYGDRMTQSSMAFQRGAAALALG
ncbi:MAG: hypothetical protein P4M15_01605 [Alphaproteobacteria bacterium]|nr:hypothetical protein [Alphaproteobacteria bacterium]